MTSTLRKIALQMTIPVLCGLIVLNAYVVSKNLQLIQTHAADRVEPLEIQAEISNLRLDLQDMESGQQGYLLTGDPLYLQPYNAASERLASRFASLRARSAGADRSLETHLEAVAESKIAEMKETIRLREQGYRHRAFLIVNSNRGHELMNEARRTLDAWSSAQAVKVARYDRELAESISTAVKQSALASGILLLVTVATLLGLNSYRKRLEVACARHSDELQATRLRLERLTSTIFFDIRALFGEIRGHANTLLDAYGGFLPRQGQEKVERIADGAGQMIRLLDDSCEKSPSENPMEVADGRPLERLSA